MSGGLVVQNIQHARRLLDLFDIYSFHDCLQSVALLNVSCLSLSTCCFFFRHCWKTRGLYEALGLLPGLQLPAKAEALLSNDP